MTNEQPTVPQELPVEQQQAMQQAAVEQQQMSTRELSIPYINRVEARALPPAAIAASALILTGALTGAANYFNGEHGRPEMPAIDVEWSRDHVAVHAGGKDFEIGGKDGEKITITDGRQTETVPATTQQETKDLIGSMEEEWARRFAEDMKAGKLINPGEIDTFAEQVKAETAGGWKIESISTFGTASAEDDTVNAEGVRTAGLQETSPEAAQKQAELGDHRRDVGTLQLAAALGERGVQVDAQQIELLPSIEDVLDDAEVGIIDGMAERGGFKNTTVMIEQWNRAPETVPTEVDAFLTEALAKERTFNVKVSMSRESAIPGSDGSVPTPDGPEKTPGSAGGSEDHKFRLFPMLLPGYILIGIGRKRIGLPGGKPSAPAVSGGTPPRLSVPVSVPSAETVVEQPPEPPKPPRTPREQFPRAASDRMPRSRVDAVAYRRKQPRNHNFSKRSGRLAGGSGRMSRSHGGNRSGKR